MYDETCIHVLNVGFNFQFLFLKIVKIKNSQVISFHLDII